MKSEITRNDKRWKNGNLQMSLMTGKKEVTTASNGVELQEKETTGEWDRYITEICWERSQARIFY